MAGSNDCPHCDRSFPTSRALDDHIARSHPDATEPTNWTPILVGALAVLAVAAVGAALLMGGGGNAETPYHVEESPRTGDERAPVTLIAFESPACPNCKRFHLGSGDGPSAYEQLLETYVEPGEVRYVEKFSPIRYSWERTAANAQKCVWHQGGWEAFHGITQAYYTNQNSMDASNAAAFATDWAQGASSVNANELDDCIRDARYSHELDRDVSDGRGAGVRGTPTFIILAPDGTSQQVVGPQPFSHFQGLIEDALAKTSDPGDAGTDEPEGNGSTSEENGTTRHARSTPEP